jgi:hypothetical protein
MPRLKSLIVTMEITTAGHSHGCRFNKKHRFAKGDSRLTIFPEKHHYCLACARVFLAKDIEKLQTLLTKIEESPLR